jgi:hypothetical protein
MHKRIALKGVLKFTLKYIGVVNLVVRLHVLSGLQ